MSSMATFFYANPVDALFQGEGDVALYGNLFVNPYGNAIHIQSHNDIPKDIDIAFNTVLAARTGITVMPAARSVAFRQSVVGNAVFAATPLVGGARRATSRRRSPTRTAIWSGRSRFPARSTSPRAHRSRARVPTPRTLRNSPSGTAISMAGNECSDRSVHTRLPERIRGGAPRFP